MKRIKTFLIHLLGGVTVSELQERGVDRSFVGAFVALTIIKKYSESLYGKPADEWCKLIYEQICKQLESVEHGADKERPTAHP